MATVSLYLSITILNTNGLNSPTKRHSDSMEKRKKRKENKTKK